MALITLDLAPTREAAGSPSWTRWFHQVYTAIQQVASSVSSILSGGTLTNTTLAGVTTLTGNETSPAGIPHYFQDTTGLITNRLYNDGAGSLVLDAATDGSSWRNTFRANSDASLTLNCQDAAGAGNLYFTAAAASAFLRKWFQSAGVYYLRDQCWISGASYAPVSEIDSNGNFKFWCGASVSTSKVNFSNAAAIAFGSDWQSFTCTVSASGSMTVSGVVINDASYLRIGPLAQVRLYVTGTLGGTLSTQLFLTLPLANPGVVQGVSGHVSQGSGAWTAGVAWIENGESRVKVMASGQPNFVAGNFGVLMSFSYRVA